MKLIIEKFRVKKTKKQKQNGDEKIAIFTYFISDISSVSRKGKPTDPNTCLSQPEDNI